MLRMCKGHLTSSLIMSVCVLWKSHLLSVTSTSGLPLEIKSISNFVAFFFISPFLEYLHKDGRNMLIFLNHEFSNLQSVSFNSTGCCRNSECGSVWVGRVCVCDHEWVRANENRRVWIHGGIGANSSASLSLPDLFAGLAGKRGMWTRWHTKCPGWQDWHRQITVKQNSHQAAWAALNMAAVYRDWLRWSVLVWSGLVYFVCSLLVGATCPGLLSGLI